MILSDLADEIFTELGEPDDVTSAVIVYWLKTNVGQLNNLLDTDFITDDTTITPSPNDQEKVIFKLLYTIYYYGRQVNKNLGAAAFNSISEVTEGNITVRRTNKNEVAKNFLALVKDARDQLQDNVVTYKINATSIEQIVVTPPNLLPSPRRLYNNYPRGDY